jgi:hypothetical protein
VGRRIRSQTQARTKRRIATPVTSERDAALQARAHRGWMPPAARGLLRLLGLVFEQLDLVFYLELLSLYIVDQVLVGQRPVDFVL